MFSFSETTKDYYSKIINDKNRWISVKLVNTQGGESMNSHIFIPQILTVILKFNKVQYKF